MYRTEHAVEIDRDGVHGEAHVTHRIEELGWQKDHSASADCRICEAESNLTFLESQVYAARTTLRNAVSAELPSDALMPAKR